MKGIINNKRVIEDYLNESLNEIEWFEIGKNKITIFTTEREINIFPNINSPRRLRKGTRVNRSW